MMPKNIFLFILPASLIFLIGCKSFQLEQPISYSPNDWVMFGGSSLRDNRAVPSISPPLSLEWDYNAGGGFGKGALLTASNLLFVSTLHGELHILQLPDGERKGRLKFGGPIHGSPLLVKNIIIVPTADGDNTLYAYDLLEGRFIWKRNLGPIESSLLLVDESVYVSSTNGTLYSIEYNTGEIKWEFKLGSRSHSSPAGKDGVVYVGANNGKVFAVDAHDGKQLWSVAGKSAVVCAPVLDDKRIYVTFLDSTLAAYDLKTGVHRWTANLGAKLYAAPALSADRVIIGTTRGKLIALFKESGELVWESSGRSVINTPPVISGDIVYTVSLDKHVYAKSVNDGSERWSHKLSGRIKSTPVVWNNLLFVCTEDRHVYAFQGGDPI